MILVLHSVVRLLVLAALQVLLLFLVGLLTLGLVLEKVLRFRHACCCLNLLVGEKIPPPPMNGTTIYQTAVAGTWQDSGYLF